MYKDFVCFIVFGVEEGWVVDVEIVGFKYCCVWFVLLCVEIFFFSIIVVLMDSIDNM